MKKTSIRFGLYAMALGAVLFLASLVLVKDATYNLQEILGYAGIIAALLFVFFGIKHYRDVENNGSVSFGTGLGIGMIISAFAGLGFAGVDYLYTAVINPNFMADFIAKSEDPNMEPWSSFELSAFMFITVLVIGFIISLISALILQRKN